MKQEAIAATESPAEYQPWEDALPSLVEAIKAQGMPTTETVGTTAKLLLQVKLGATCIDTWRKAQGKPYGEAKKETDGHYKPALDVLKRLEELLKDQISTLAGAQEAARQTALAAGEKPQPPLEVEGVTLSQVPDSRLINESLVPDEFKSVDWKKVDAHAKTHEVAGTDCFIPGIKFFKKFRVIASAKG